MLLQVNLREDHQYHRFLWRNYDLNEELTVFKFQHLLFGNTASPFCAQYVLHLHAKTHSREFPEAAESVNYSIYIDDLVDFCETVKHAKNLQTQLSNLLTLAGFKLQKWSSNDEKVLHNIPEDRLSCWEITSHDTSYLIQM